MDHVLRWSHNILHNMKLTLEFFTSRMFSMQFYLALLIFYDSKVIK